MAAEEGELVMEKRAMLLTGAGGRLGQEICRQVRDEYDIAAVYRTRMPQVPTHRDVYVDPLEPDVVIGTDPAHVFAIEADLSEPGTLANVAKLALDRFGRIDVLVNAAAHSRWGSLVSSGPALDSIQMQLKVNVAVPALLAAEIARCFWADRRQENQAENRNVINVSSIAGLNVYPGQGQGIYGASKAALNALTRHMAEEYAEFGVRVNALAPNSFPRLVRTEDVVSRLILLDRGDVTGKIMLIDRTGVRLV